MTDVEILRWLNENATLIVAVAPREDGRRDDVPDLQIVWHPNLDISIEDAVFGLAKNEED